MKEKPNPEEVMKNYRSAGGPPIEYEKGWYYVGHGVFHQAYRRSDIEIMTNQLEYRKARGETQ